ncbi:MAG: class I SAM-dependent methyltransferase [Sulfuritalea sp.]|nr:class I SAM-dependent methyltransferase [Sulfuritalea sp.]
MNGHISEKASLWVQRFLPLVMPGGAILDLACGRGRNSLLMAERGYQVECADRDAEALAEISATTPSIVTRQCDLEAGPWPYYGRTFDGVVVTNYLYRPLLPMLLNALDINGVLIYETFMVGNERFGKPSNPAFLLRPGELLELVGRRLTVVAFEQGEIDTPRPAVVQRLCATRRIDPKLPV